MSYEIQIQDKWVVHLAQPTWSNAGSGCPVLRIVNMKVLPFNFFNPHNEHVNFLPKKSLEH